MTVRPWCETMVRDNNLFLSRYGLLTTSSSVGVKAKRRIAVKRNNGRGKFEQSQQTELNQMPSRSSSPPNVEQEPPPCHKLSVRSSTDKMPPSKAPPFSVKSL